MGLTRWGLWSGIWPQIKHGSPADPRPGKEAFRRMPAGTYVPSAAATPLEWNLNFAEHAEARASAFSARGALLFRAAGGAWESRLAMVVALCSGCSGSCVSPEFPSLCLGPLGFLSITHRLGQLQVTRHIPPFTLLRRETSTIYYKSGEI